jgi:hypothetical protein
MKKILFIICFLICALAKAQVDTNVVTYNNLIFQTLVESNNARVSALEHDIRPAFQKMDNKMIYLFSENQAWDFKEHILGIVSNLPTGTNSPWIANVTGGTNTLAARIIGDEYGAMLCATGTAATNRAGMYTGNTSILFEVGKTYEIEVKGFQITAMSGTANVIVGFTDATTGVSIDGASFVFNTTNFNINCVNSNNGAINSIVGGTWAVNAMYKLRIKVNGVTNVQYFVNDILIATNTLNIPQTAGREFGMGVIINSSVGVVSKTCRLDGIKWRCY